MSCTDLSKKFIYPQDYEALGLCSHGAVYINIEEYKKLSDELAEVISETVVLGAGKETAKKWKQQIEAPLKAEIERLTLLTKAN